MSALAVNETLDFNSLKEYLDITDGNLASHIKALEKEEFYRHREELCWQKTKHQILHYYRGQGSI